MTTKGNLELRVGKRTLVAGVDSDGYNVYRAIVQLALLHDRYPDGTKLENKEFIQWFREMIPKIISGKVYPQLIGGVPCEVIIDIGRKLVLHNGHDDNYSVISEEFPYTVAGALDRLANSHNYQILEFTSPEVREIQAEQSRKSSDKS